MKPLKIETLKIKDVKPYENNPKAHPPEQIEKICRSIKEYGFRSPIIVDQGNVLVAGHGRLLAAQRLGLKTVPAIRATDLTPDQVRAYRIADNKLQELSTWDWQALAKDFTLEEVSALTTTTGMTETDLQNFIDAAHVPLTPDETAAATNAAAEDPDDFEAAMAAPVEPKMAIVPQYCESYEAFIIICTNTVDEAYMRQALNLNDIAQSCMDTKVGRPNILTVEQFKEQWESRS